jgi:hypothetical protein
MILALATKADAEAWLHKALGFTETDRVVYFHKALG